MTTKSLRPKSATASGTGQDLYARAKQRIPGGTQLFGKRSEQYLPGGWPAYFRRAQGCTIWDLDERPYIDFTSNGMGSCLLGYADKTVTEAVTRRATEGNMCTLNPPEEVYLADRLCAIHPWAEKVRFARTGGESMAIAVRIARAATGRSKLAICGYHGWSDWYLAANLSESSALNGHLLPGLDPAGVPSQLQGTAIPFRYNEIAELEKIVAKHRGDLAAIVLEPMRSEPPRDGFLDKVKALAKESGAVLIFDEITAGWRSHFGGIHLKLNATPDIAVFGKAMSNGYPMGAIIGRGAVMDAAQNTFISSLYWTESIGPTAALAAIDKMEALNVVAHIQTAGQRVQAGWRAAGAKHGLKVRADGLPALCAFAFDYGDQSLALMTLFTQEMLSRGYLAGRQLYPNYAHQPPVIDRYLQTLDEVFGFLRERVDQGEVLEALEGPVIQTGFARLA